MVSAAWRTRSPTSAALSDSRSSSRADWSRAIAWHLSTSCLAVARRGSRGGLFVLVRHAEEEAGSYTTQRDVTRRTLNGEGADDPLNPGPGTATRRTQGSSPES